MPTWTILQRAAKRFSEDELADRAAALTYFAVLALFPALIVMVALLGLLGEYPRTPFQSSGGAAGWGAGPPRTARREGGWVGSIRCTVQSAAGAVA